MTRALRKTTRRNAARQAIEPPGDAGGRAALTTAEATPHARLARLAAGQAPLDVGDLQSVLAANVLDADRQARTLRRRVQDLTEMLFNVKAAKRLEPTVVLELMSRIDNLQRGQAQELRRAVDLLARLSAGPRPRVQVVAAAQVNVTSSPQRQPVDLGDHDDAPR